MRIMAEAAPAETRYTAERYFALLEQGVIQPEDRVELLDGVIVTGATVPQSPAHAFVIVRLARILHGLLGPRETIRTQMPFVAGSHSVPEPDVAVVPGADSDYVTAHPTSALLVVEVADSSLHQDRLTKLPIYAAANVPEAWIVNLVNRCVEVFRSPVPQARHYAESRVGLAGERIELVAIPAASVAVGELLPDR